MSEFHEEELYGAIARGWCDERNSSKEFDANLADAIAIEVLVLIRPLRAENERLREALVEICGYTTPPRNHEEAEVLELAEQALAALERPE